MAMKGYSAFPKAPALLEPHHQIVYCHIRTLVRASYPSAEVQSVYSTAPADLANVLMRFSVNIETDHQDLQELTKIVGQIFSSILYTPSPMKNINKMQYGWVVRKCKMGKLLIKFVSHNFVRFIYEIRLSSENDNAEMNARLKLVNNSTVKYCTGMLWN